MSRRVTLEVFEQATESPLVVLNGEDYEDARLAAFEQGYRDGWDDAIANQAEQQGEVRNAIAARLGALAGDVAAVRAEVVAAFRPLMEEIVASLLPDIARAALPAQIVEALAPFAELTCEMAVELYVRPECAAAAEAALIEANCPMPIRLVEDDTLGDGAAVIRLGPAETRIDLDAVIDRIRALASDFFDHIERDRRHG